MPNFMYAILGFLSSFITLTLVRRAPAAKVFVDIEQSTKLRAYLHGFAWTFLGKPGGLYYINYVNTFEWNKQGRYN